MKLYFFKSKYKNGYIRYYFCGIRIYKKKTEVCQVLEAFEANEAFNTIYLDKKIAKYVCKSKIKNELSGISITNNNKIAFLATEL